MSLAEFHIFAAAWLVEGRRVDYCENKRFLSRNGDGITKRSKSLAYASNRTLEEYEQSDGRKGALSKVVAVFEGPCANLLDGQCAIYDQRPDACRRFKLDSPACSNLRDEATNIFLE